MHNAQNACAAVAVAHALGVDMGAMMRGLESVRPEPGRLCPRKLRSGQLILDDSYNANPTSMRAGLEVLTSMPGPHVAVLGSMGELGDEEVSLHQALGKTAKAMGVDYLVCAGVFAADMARGFGEGAVAVEDAARAAEWLKNNMTADKAATMLVKGSRSAHMEIVVRALCDQWGEQDALLADTMAD
jgi:UDP-N-acetylmuramoyl-tripeptide--D-alanyl-D-alanine ligase